MFNSTYVQVERKYVGRAKKPAREIILAASKYTYFCVCQRKQKKQKNNYNNNDDDEDRLFLRNFFKNITNENEDCFIPFFFFIMSVFIEHIYKYIVLFLVPP